MGLGMRERRGLKVAMAEVGLACNEAGHSPATESSAQLCSRRDCSLVRFGPVSDSEGGVTEVSSSVRGKGIVERVPPHAERTG